jgi:antitoxin component of MazEF toxin-antitoxin module
MNKWKVRKLFKRGLSSLGVTIPMKIVEDLDLNNLDEMEIRRVGKTIVIRKKVL